MSFFSKQKGYQFEGNLYKAIIMKYKLNYCFDVSHVILTENNIDKQFGKYFNGKHNILGVDILCIINDKIYAIQCKQVSAPSTSTAM